MSAPAPLPEGWHLGVLGCGNLGTTLVRGLLAAGLEPERVHVTTLPPDGAEALAEELGVVAHEDNTGLVGASNLVILTVKPQQVAGVCKEIRRSLGRRVLLTCAAGVPTSRCAARLGSAAHVARAMPNVAAGVRRGTAALWLPAELSEEELDACRGVFAASGAVVELPDERLFDAATALVGSGPAFVCLLVEALADGAVRAGMPRDTAASLAVSMVRGAAALLEVTGEHPAVWKDRVMSPGGTTAAALFALERGGFRAVLMDALGEATRRARELGGEA